MYIYVFDSRGLLLFFAEWTNVVLQSLRPNIHMSVGTRWVNSKAAAVTTPFIPQQHDCLLNLVQQPFFNSPQRGGEGWSLSESIAVNLRGSVRSKIRGLFPAGSPTCVRVFFFLHQFSAVDSCCPALIPTCVSIQLLSGCPAGGGERSIEVTGAYLCRALRWHALEEISCPHNPGAYVRCFEQERGKYLNQHILRAVCAHAFV